MWAWADGAIRNSPLRQEAGPLGGPVKPSLRK